MTQAWSRGQVDAAIALLKQINTGEASVLAAVQALPSNDVDDDPLIRQAINEIAGLSAGHTVSVESKAKSLLKFGRNSALNNTTFETIWEQGGHETYVSTNAIDRVSSSNAGNTQSVVIEGHTISGSDLTFVVQTATLNGQNKVTLTTPLARATRMYNNGSTDFAGTVYVFEDDTVTGGVPNTASKIHLVGSGAPRNQTEKAATAFSSTDYMLVTHLYGSVSTKTAATVEFVFQIRESGKVFRNRAPGFSAARDSGASVIPLRPYLIVPPNADCRLIGKATANNTEAEGGFGGYLAAVV